MDWPLSGLCHDTVDYIVTSGKPSCGRVTIQLIVSLQGAEKYGRWLCSDTTQSGLRYGKRQDLGCYTNFVSSPGGGLQ